MNRCPHCKSINISVFTDVLEFCDSCGSYFPKESVMYNSKFQQLQDELGEWADSTFGPRTAESLLNHLREELDEVIADPTDEHEWADCLQLLIDAYRLATGNSTDKLLDSSFQKLEILKTRKWHPADENGIVRHIK